MKAQPYFFFAITLLLVTTASFAQSNINWLTSGALPVNRPGFIEGISLSGEDFDDKFILSNLYLDLLNLRPSEGEVLLWNDHNTRKWEILTAPEEEFVTLRPDKNPEYQIAYNAIYIDSEGLYDYKLEIESPQMFEIFLMGGKIASSYKVAEENRFPEQTATLKLDRGKFLVIVKSLYVKGDENDWMFKASFSGTNVPVPALSTLPSCRMNIHHLLEGTKLRSVSVSPDGSLIMINYSELNTQTGQSHSWTEVKKISTGEILQSFRQAGTTGFSWMPKGRKLYYTREGENGSTLWVYDFSTGKEYKVFRNEEDLYGLQWSASEEFIIYGISEKDSGNKKSSLRYMDELGNRTFMPERVVSLYHFEVASGISTRLSFGENSTSLEDISRDGNFIAFSVSRPNSTVPPFRLQSMYFMDLRSGKVDTLWKDFPYGGSVQFSPDGGHLLVSGGPDCFGETGKRTRGQPFSNETDIQLYIFNLETREIDPITKNFNPAVKTATWHPADGKIYLAANDEIYVRAFCWNPKTREFLRIRTVPDVISDFSIAGGSLTAAYTGSGLGNPPRAWVLGLESGQNKPIDQIESGTYENVIFGRTEEWDFITSDSTKIRGYFICPPGFDPAKKYPLIVNYYGGVTPVEMYFGGRYPKDIWACEGYVVYVPQPSGAIGFGQEFSSRHQNDWGKTVADEIIEGTKKFVETHPFIDPDNIGCIGASYGGFITMLLLTRTDIFTCAIAHAGISSISSYWGEGYWGYWYNTVASQGSYPWNRKDLYVEQSPLFSADKISTPLLLLHGSKDVNVPLGESLQMWVGLKILGKPVEMVQVEGEDHHILDYSKRIEWHNTIMAWFDKWLKDRDHDWKKLFPDSTL